MIRCNNDYSRGAHPAILKALEEINETSFGGYGTDEICETARKDIAKYLDCPNAEIHFVVGGTQANVLMIEAALTRKYHGVICANSGHINVHESGSIENTGHKLLALPAVDGKLSAEQIADEAEAFRSSPLQEHICEPKAVYISFPTEYGTIYSKKELREIRAVCDEYKLHLIIDGARMSYGLASERNDLTLADICDMADIFYIGGTKCGLLFGEAVVITNDEIKVGFRNYMKLYGALLAKGWLLGLQFHVMFADGLYFDIAKDAVEYAEIIKYECLKKGLAPYVVSDTNQLFYVMSKEMIAKLEEDFFFEVMDPVDNKYNIIRFCTSWSTTREEAEALADAISML
ncbi:MAG: aminotransferase class I/II-fold pyridoxal phosphate-dependent enzyme [Mogibacterium sp.]|nr:aminotransferase class I/II-fold pyridoxal phosphate-dependent enzyme [Mogibacterium sp.]